MTHFDQKASRQREKIIEAKLDDLGGKDPWGKECKGRRKRGTWRGSRDPLRLVGNTNRKICGPQK